ncbi:MAG TPA: Asd/ArgC dimerization domain-containing protein [Terriglobia bacterium]|nr:Asd/ArgC dimerization domain-containing protein [Terriglobia bacterium]
MNLDRLQRAPNIALVGSSSPVGKELKDLIQESGLPVGNLKLIDTEEYAGLLQEFAGQIQITQVISPSAFENVDIAFFACSPEIMRSFAASGASIPEVSIDLTQTGREGTLFLNGVTSLSQISPMRDGAYFISPHPSVIVLARILFGLHRRFPVDSATVTILEPASERGASAIDELQEQTVRLLNFQPAESKLFKGQIAFNILPETEAAKGTEQLIRRQLAAILGNSVPSPNLMMLQAPVFHSESFSMFVRFSKAAAAPAIGDVRSCLEDAGGGVVVNEDAEDGASPVRVVGSDKVHIGRIAQDPEDASIFSFWITADNLRLAASNALGIAESVMLSAATPR